MPKISIVIPCYFNEGNIPVTTAALIENEKNFSSEVTFEYVFVDDGSGDGTLRELIGFYQQFPQKVKVISLAENVGSYNAICAGFEYATGECIVVMSADLQDPPELIKEMYAKWCAGSKVVLAVRERRNDPFSTKVFATIFHGILRISGVPDLPKGGFDYCLFDRSLIPELQKRMISGINVLFLLLQIQEKTETILYERRKREIGRSQWTFRKKMKLAWNTLSFFLLKKPGNIKKVFHINEGHGV